MLPRVLEPEVMDTPEAAAAYDALDHAEVNRVFVTDLLAAGPLEGLLLDLGTGTAQLPIELCRRCDRCYVLAVDLSVQMLELARYNIEVASLIQQIQLGHVDAKQLPYGNDQFTAVISNGTLHHIPDPTAMLAEAARVVAPGGLLFFRDLLRPDSDDAVQRLVQGYTGQATEHQQQLFAASLRAAFRLDELQALVAQLGFDPEMVRATSDRHWTWQARK